MQEARLCAILEAALFAQAKPLALEQMQELFSIDENVSRESIEAALRQLQAFYQGRGVELVRIASGYRFQVPFSYAPWVSRLMEEKPQRYSRALLETLALIAYRQPVTRGDIEEIRGVAVSTQILRTLMERDWIRVAGHRDVPGRPALYVTTRQFLDSFQLTRLADLPPLSALRDLEQINAELELLDVGQETKTNDVDEVNDDE